MSQTDLGTLIAISATAHKGQKDKGGKPYILHPMRIMMKFQHVSNCEDFMAVAICHDLIEDCDITLEDIQKYCSKSVLEAIDLLTKKDGQNYMDYIVAIKFNELARMVKKADIQDNSDLTRLKGVTEKDLKRVQKYNLSYAFLADKIGYEEFKEKIQSLI